MILLNLFSWSNIIEWLILILWLEFWVILVNFFFKIELVLLKNKIELVFWVLLKVVVMFFGVLFIYLDLIFV